MRGTERKQNLDSLLVLLLLAVFGVCLLLVLLAGARSYRDITRRDGEAYDRRTAAQYLTTRVHQSDRAGGVYVEQFHGEDALVFSEKIDGDVYHTRVYCRDGYLRELFAPAGSGLLPEDGEKVLPCQGLTAQMTRNSLLLTLTLPTGAQEQLVLYLRSGEGEFL